MTQFKENPTVEVEEIIEEVIEEPIETPEDRFRNNNTVLNPKTNKLEPLIIGDKIMIKGKRRKLLTTEQIEEMVAANDLKLGKKK